MRNRRAREVLKHQIGVAVEAVGGYDRGRGTHTLLRYDKGGETAPAAGDWGVGRGRSANSAGELATTQNFGPHLVPLPETTADLPPGNFVMARGAGLVHPS